MRQALEKDRPTLTYNCKPYQNPITRPLEPEKSVANMQYVEKNVAPFVLNFVAR